MALEHLEGTTYGPFRVTLSRVKVAEYVAATHDDPDRWVDVAPPGYAGALLFVAAPAFLEADEVSGHTAVLIHADQTFVWHGPLQIGADVDVVARIERVRARGGVDFVTFRADVSTTAGEALLESVSTFLLGAEAAAETPEPRSEPPVAAAARFDPIPDPADGSWSPAIRSASRLDLVRYAAASGDFNPIHFDHDAARGAGLAGIVVHGLAMGAWLLQPATTLRPGPAPLARAKLRFRDPLYAGELSVLDGTVREDGVTVDARLVRGDEDTLLVSAQITLAER